MNFSDHSYSPDFLTAELQARGLYVLVGPLPAFPSPRLADEALVAALAQQQDARVRAALIPLFLQQPDLEKALPQALTCLLPDEQTTLKIYYTAAVILQDEVADTLRTNIPQWQPLPDRYSGELGVDRTRETEQQLRDLGRVHTRLTGLDINWPGTYRHAAERLIRRLRAERRWAA